MTTPTYDPIQAFYEERSQNICRYSEDASFSNMSRDWMVKAFEKRYMYNFDWLSRPIIQMPADMVAMQEIIWSVRPDLIIETGVAHGGSLMLSASMLALLDYCDAIRMGGSLANLPANRRVIGIDIDIRRHNRAAIESHPIAHKIDLIQGSSVSSAVIDEVKHIAQKHSCVLVCLDSNHTHEHVLQELRAYAPMTSRGSYCVVFDTIIEDMPNGLFPDRPWKVGDNSKTAVWAYLEELENGEVQGLDGEHLHLEYDHAIEKKLMLTAAPNGYLKRA